MDQRLDDEALLDRNWDFIIVGSGMGGATLGHALAKAGRSVLFCDAGRYHPTAANALAGDWVENLTATGPSPDELRRAGRFWDQLTDVTGPKPTPMQPLLGFGAGGSSALFGMVMERFFPADFAPGPDFRDSPEANVPERWPVRYDEMEPYYVKAEALYGVRGTPDPLRQSKTSGGSPSPPFSPASAELADGLSAQGLHPYHIPMACAFSPGCNECLGYICPRRCKRDSMSVCLEPALRDDGAAMLTECEVDTLEAADGQVTGVWARWRGRKILLRGATVVLAAGAIQTPAILLRSGLANGSDQVGRNLMRHFLDYYILYPKADPAAGLQMQLGFNDFYFSDGKKLGGTIKSNGRTAPPRALAKVMLESLCKAWPPLARLLPILGPIIEGQIARMLRRSYVMVAFVEDLPYAENRVALAKDGGGVTLSYKIAPQDAARVATFRQKLSRVLAPFRFKLVPLAKENIILAHACGTCRFGDDPGASVLDRNNRAHELENLYVVDGSFLPTSSGINPALTIAANALRVADTILART